MAGSWLTHCTTPCAAPNRNGPPGLGSPGRIMTGSGACATAADRQRSISGEIGREPPKGDAGEFEDQRSFRPFRAEDGPAGGLVAGEETRHAPASAQCRRRAEKRQRRCRAAPGNWGNRFSCIWSEAVIPRPSYSCLTPGGKARRAGYAWVKLEDFHPCVGLASASSNADLGGRLFPNAAEHALGAAYIPPEGCAPGPTRRSRSTAASWPKEWTPKLPPVAASANVGPWRTNVGYCCGAAVARQGRRERAMGSGWTYQTTTGPRRALAPPCAAACSRPCCRASD